MFFKRINIILDTFLEDFLMLRIPDAELERLKVDVSLERLVEARGIALKQRAGRGSGGVMPIP